MRVVFDRLKEGGGGRADYNWKTRITGLKAILLKKKVLYMIIYGAIGQLSHRKKAENRQLPVNNDLPAFKAQAAIKSNFRSFLSRGVVIVVVPERTIVAPASWPEKSRIARFKHIPRPRRFKTPPIKPSPDRF
jgi:hypothetical protein